MLEVEHIGQNQWQVTSAGVPVFSGPMQRVENWLDYQENAVRQLKRPRRLESCGRAARHLAESMINSLKRPFGRASV